MWGCSGEERVGKKELEVGGDKTCAALDWTQEGCLLCGTHEGHASLDLGGRREHSDPPGDRKLFSLAKQHVTTSHVYILREVLVCSTLLISLFELI
jgi:hypothetical protein